LSYSFMISSLISTSQIFRDALSTALCKLHYDATTSHVRSSTAPGLPVESKPYPCRSSDQDADEPQLQDTNADLDIPAFQDPTQFDPVNQCLNKQISLFDGDLANIQCRWFRIC
jgi:hypothetical protein